MTRELSNDGAAFIKHWEGLRLYVYLDANGKATIGYGHLVTAEHLEAYRNGIDMPIAIRLFKNDIKYFVDIVNYASQNLELMSHQFDVIVSFAFNIGSTAFLRSTLLRDLQAKRFDLISKEMNRWVHGDHGVLIPGLVNRRRAEGRIFDNKLSMHSFLANGSEFKYKDRT